MRRILVLRGGALGDFIVTLPALALLRQRWPDAQIELAGNATAAQLARVRGLLDGVHSQHEARWAALYGPDDLPAAFAAWLAEFDLVVNYWPDPDRTLARHFPRRTGQTFLSASALPAQSPAAAHYCEPLRALGLATRDSFFRLAPLAAESISTPPTLADTLVVHPGSGSPRKNWPIARWQALLACLPAPVAIVLGEAEMETWSDATVGQQATTWRNLPLETLVARFAACRLFIGHDSGISHLAAAAGAKCVLLFGPTDPACWAPPTPEVEVLHSTAGLMALTRETVQQAVTRAIADRR
ncbi:glycosyltransferase family 9 protein [Horticoccus sp. 23ND18S-11]|uniref:glycosyltransferase family 9 protein n=1 Tax=Horticoccus sp. 23ND18S-11 TaxID=3391832 RepID=UPI0039C9A825